MAPLLVTLNDLEGHSRLPAFSSAIPGTFVQYFTRFQLTAHSHGPSVTAGFLVFISEVASKKDYLRKTTYDWLYGYDAAFVKLLWPLVRWCFASVLSAGCVLYLRESAVFLLFLPVFTGSIASVEEGRFVQRIINCVLHKDCRVSVLLVTHRRRVGLCFCQVPFSLVDALRPIGKPLI